MKLATTWIGLLSISTLATCATTTFDTRASQHPAPTPNPHTKPTVKATPHGTPSKSSAPAGHTGGSDTDNWKQLGCKDPSTTNEDMDVKQRWEKAGAPHAWEDAVHNFDEHDKKEDVDFSKSVSDYFHGPPNVFCGKSLGQETNCKEVPDCNSAGSHTFNTSAGYLIMRSMVTWNQAFVNMFEAISEAHNNVDVIKVTNIFSPTTNHKTKDAIMIDAILLGIGVVTAPMWNKWFRSTPVFKGHSDGLGTTKDAVNSILIRSLTILKDSSKAGAELAKIEKVSDVLDTLHESWSKGVSTVAENMFNGSSVSNKDLYNHIKDGQFLNLDDPSGVKGDDITTAETAYYAPMITAAWNQGDLAPFILKSGQKCDGDKNSASKKWIHRWVSDGKGLKDQWACYKGEAYYLASAPGKDAEGCPNTDGCWIRSFKPLPGAGQLDGHTWGQLKVQDFIIGYEKNGNKNGYKGDSFETGVVEELVNHEFTAAGVFTLPVCDTKEAGKAWWHHSNAKTGSDPEHYPCK